MKIKTKYNIGDEVWFILRNKARQGKILGITFNKLGYSLIDYYYNIQVGMSHGSFCEPNLFHTKEELLNSL